MKLFYDLHIHSDLSPCASREMTPNNIINMSIVKGLNVISLTDHNSTANLPALIEASHGSGLKVIPGIEVTSKEEVHLLCYFRELSRALKFGTIIYQSLPPIINMPEIFGEQNIYNSNDEIVGVLDKLLINATPFSIGDINNMVKESKGIMIPAHINKMSNSILSILGFIPKDLEVDFVEIYSKNPINKKMFEKYKILKNSDAHCLTDISEAVNFFDLNDMDSIYNIKEWDTP